MKTKKKKKRSFARRLTWRIVLVLTITNIAIIAAILLFVVAGTVGQSSQHYLQLMNFTEDKLESMLTAVEVSAKSNVAEIEAHLENPTLVYDALEREMRMNPQLAGCFVAFEAGYYRQKGRWYEPYVVRRDSTTTERLQIGSVHHDYFQYEWYQKGLEATEGYWSDPYLDSDGCKAMVCSFVFPIHNSEGRIVGVFGTDLPLTWLKEQMNEMLYNKNDIFYTIEDGLDMEYFCFAIGRNGQYIVHPDSNMVLRNSLADDVQATPDTDDDFVYNQMMEGKAGARRLSINGTSSMVYYSPLGHAGWSMGIVIPRIILYIWGIVIGILIVLVMFFGAIVITLICLFTIRHVTKPLRHLARSAGEVAKGHFNTPLPRIKHYDEIGQLRDSFETMQQSLGQYVEELKDTTTQKASMESELRIANSIQMSMLPKTFPAFPDRTDIDIFGQVTPAKAVGGDLYDFFIRDEKLFFCIGDVSGKGIPASLVMAVTRSLFHNISIHTAKPDNIIMALNDALCESNDSNMFVTIFVGVLDLPTGRMRYSNAGHDAPLLLCPAQGIRNACLPTVPNLPVGVIAGQKFLCQETMIAPGTTIFLYTDGLTEAEDARQQLFGLKRIKEVLQTAPEAPQPLIATMSNAVHQFVNGTEQSDDLTMLAVQYTPKQQAIRLSSSITLLNDVEEVTQLATFVEGVCEEVGYDASMTMKVELAIEEAVVNVIDYAYPAGIKGEIHISAEVTDQWLTFVISDNGIPFDPTTHGNVDTTLTVEERSIGGLGIHLVRNLMDTINYERANGQNIFTLRKRL